MAFTASTVIKFPHFHENWCKTHRCATEIINRKNEQKHFAAPSDAPRPVHFHISNHVWPKNITYKTVPEIPIADIFQIRRSISWGLGRVGWRLLGLESEDINLTLIKMREFAKWIALSGRRVERCESVESRFLSSRNRSQFNSKGVDVD